MAGFDIQGARKAGYGDSEIAAQLAQRKGFDLDGARKAGYSDTEIADKLAGYEKPGVIEDTVKSALGKGLPTAITSRLGGVAADVGNLAALGGGFAAKGVYYGAQKLGADWAKEDLTPEQEALIYRKPFYGSEEIARGAAKLAGADLYEPETRAGKMADTVTQFAFGNPFTKAEKAAVQAAPTLVAKVAQAGKIAAPQAAVGAISEGAGQLYEGTPYEAAARIGGAVAGGAGVGAAGFFRNEGSRQLTKAMDGLTAEQFAMAQQLQKQAADLGTPITGAEAIAQVTNNPKSALLTLQRVAEQSPETAAPMSNFFAGRAQGNDAAFRQQVAGMGEQVGSPYEIAPRVQGAAGSVIKDAERMRTDATKDFYKTAGSERLPAENLQQLIDEIDATISSVGPNTESVAALQQLKNKLLNGGVPEDQISRLQTAYKETRDKLDAQPLDPNGIQRTARGTVGPINQRLGEVLETNPNIKAGNERYAELSRSVVEPLKRSPLGQLADTEDLTKQIGTLFESNPPPGSENHIGTAIKNLAERDPEAARSLVAQHLERTFNESTQKLMSGDNQAGAAKYSSIIAGNAQQRKNLEQAVRALPDGDAIYDGLNKLQEVFEAQGKRLQAGSPTAQNMKYIDVLGVKVSPGDITNLGRDLLNQFRYGKSLKQISKTLTDPNSVEALRQLAKLKPDSIEATTWAGKLLNNTLNYKDYGQATVKAMRNPARAYGNVEEREQPQSPVMPEQPVFQPAEQQPAPGPQAQAPKAQGIEGVVQQTARQFGNDPSFMTKVAQIESGMNPSAKAGTSSATGLYQFTDDTWSDMVRRHGRQYGIGPNDRGDAAKNTIMANLLMNENKKALQGALKREPTPTELYMAHFLGAGGAKNLLSSIGQPVSAAELMPQAASANKSIFYSNGKPLTPAGVYNMLSKKVEA